ncbi:flagellar biosynthesis anti-sigma factor FlgM [Bacillus sp. AFS041924]|uniref:flagellar biosynthesis anti-sigma factor FlgM n=1 Tax=Bacillus sp. AFS041924 TaxID=2033503 RepID=UPI000BFD050F|nr:flagellar biosynthesis anti-sigma factor FlgM [Bacillus sp. AFS041924]PGS52621.1 flagellar biosynthesis anti-sigma factor FlgM [Bacillus sp. AFS041924]
MKSNTSTEDNIHLDQNNLKKDKQEQVKKEEISPQAKDVQIEGQLVATRDERIQRLKKQVEEGTYKVKPIEVAEKMLDFFNKK